MPGNLDRPGRRSRCHGSGKAAGGSAVIVNAHRDVDSRLGAYLGPAEAVTVVPLPTLAVWLTDTPALASTIAPPLTATLLGVWLTDTPPWDAADAPPLISGPIWAPLWMELC